MTGFSFVSVGHEKKVPRFFPKLSWKSVGILRYVYAAGCDWMCALDIRMASQNVLKFGEDLWFQRIVHS